MKRFKISIPYTITSAILALSLGVFGQVYAAESGGHTSGGHTSGGHGGGHSGGGSSGGHDSGHDHDTGDDDHGGRGSGGKGRNRYGRTGGHGHSHDVARDVSYSIETRIFRGGRPVWAQEGIPEVELGRLNVGRAPAFVLSRAEGKALEEYTDAMANLYNLSAEQAAALLESNYANIARIDSPVQNLAMYRDVLVYGETQLPGVAPASTVDLAAIFLGSASDKNIPVSEDTVIAINRILGLVEMSEQDIATLAGKAETVRASILVGHGDVTHEEPTGH
jgi:hypothetical protein